MSLWEQMPEFSYSPELEAAWHFDLSEKLGFALGDSENFQVYSFTLMHLTNTLKCLLQRLLPFNCIM
jgi:hypothetical protein